VSAVSAPKNPLGAGDLTRIRKTELIVYQNNTFGLNSGKTAINNENLAITEQNKRIGYRTKKEDIERLKRQIIDTCAVYGIDPVKIIKTVECESNFNRFAVGDNGAAVSVAQFHWSTFERYCTGNYWNAEDQLDCMVKMWATGGARNWTCATMLGFTK